MMNHFGDLIVGAGPGGLQMGYLLQRAGRDYLILEAQDSAGAFFARYPRHRTLLSLNKRFNGFPEAEFNLRHDWNSLLSAHKNTIKNLLNRAVRVTGEEFSQQVYTPEGDKTVFEPWPEEKVRELEERRIPGDAECPFVV